MVEIRIDIDENLRGIAGREFGESIYNEFVKEKINFEEKETYTIIFPQHVKVIALSFVKGMIEEILNKITVSEFEQYFTIIGSESAVRDFKEGVYY